MTIKTVAVVFPSSTREWHYLSDIEVNDGDYVIVDSPNDGYVVVRVTNVLNGALNIATKFIVSKVDETAYKARQAKEKLKRELKKKLEEKRKQIEEEAIWKYLAEQDADAAELFRQLKELSE